MDCNTKPLAEKTEDAFSATDLMNAISKFRFNRLIRSFDDDAVKVRIKPRNPDRNFSGYQTPEDDNETVKV